MSSPTLAESPTPAASIDFIYSGVRLAPAPGTTSLELRTAADEPIGYLERNHIYVWRSTDGFETAVGLSRPSEFDFNEDGTSIVLVTPSVAGDEYILRRVTPLDRYIRFVEGALLTGEQMDRLNLLNLYRDQESYDLLDSRVTPPPPSGGGTVTRVTGGAGLTGDVTVEGSLDVGAGAGITVGADSVAVDRGVTDAWYASAAQGALAGTALQPGSVNLGFTAATRTITNTGGADAQLPLVSSGAAGLAPQAPGGTTDFLRADGVWAAPPAGGGGGGVSTVSGTVPIRVATGATTPVVSIDAATPAAAGSMSGADKTKLDAMATNAQLRDRATHTGTQLAATISLSGASLVGRSSAGVAQEITLGTNLSFSGTVLNATAGGGGVSAVTGTAPIVSSGGGSPAISITPASGSAPGSMSLADFNKLAGIAPGATVNSTDAQLRDRATHTGTQAAATISDFTASSRAQVEATLTAGANITLTPSGSGATRTIAIASTAAGGGGGTVTNVTGAAPIQVASGTTTPAVSITAATTSAAGSMSAADKTKLDTLTAGANGTVTGVTGTAPIVSSGGAAPAISINAATTSAPGSMSAADKTKLDTLTAGANGTVTSVTGGAGLTGAVTTSGSLAVGAGTGITVNADDVAINRTVVDPWYATAAQGAKADLALPSNVTGITGAVRLVNQVSMTQAAYDALAVKDPGTIYVLPDGTAAGVTSVTGTAPIVSSGGTTPAISIAAASLSVAGAVRLSEDFAVPTPSVTEAPTVRALGQVHVASQLNRRLTLSLGTASLVNMPAGTLNNVTVVSAGVTRLTFDPAIISDGTVYDIYNDSGVILDIVIATRGFVHRSGNGYTVATAASPAKLQINGVLNIWFTGGVGGFAFARGLT